MNPDFCKCGGMLQPINFKFGLKLEELHCIGFVFKCKKCEEKVIHWRVPTPFGFITAKVEYLGVNE